jgi:type II secretory pathway pseudopilin PulG
MATGKSILVKSRFLQRGFTYLGLMILIVAIGISLAAAGTVWQTEVQREKEKELLFVGDQFRQAIGSYYESTPGETKQYPPSLENLLHDPRFPEMRRHLRKLFRDPITGGKEWGLVRQQGRITGVYSLSQQHPLKKAGFPPAFTAFASAENYAGWQFLYTLGTTQHTQQPTPNGGSNSAASLPVQFGNAISEGGVSSGATSDQNTTTTDVDLGRKQDCLAQSRNDAAACSVYCKGNGPVAECSLCRISLTSRYNACLKGYSLPPLAKGN